MSEQMTIGAYMVDLTHKRDGSLRPAPEWMRKERCELCENWNISPKQPADGWGIYGACTSYRHKGREVQSTGYCNDYRSRYGK